MLSTLEAIRDALSTISGVATCRLWIERAISPADWPIIRIEPQQYEPGPAYSQRAGRIRVIFGVPLADSDDAEYAIRELHRIEQEIVTTVQRRGYRVLRTSFPPWRGDYTFRIAEVLVEAIGSRF